MTDTNQTPTPEDANPDYPDGPKDPSNVAEQMPDVEPEATEPRGVNDITLEPGIQNPNDLPPENPDPYGPDAEETPPLSR